jgi:hypothetical protein
MQPKAATQSIMVYLSCRGLVAIAVLLFMFGQKNVSHAEQASTEPDWKVKFLTEAPPEWKKLERAVGGWQVLDNAKFTSFLPSKNKTPPEPVDAKEPPVRLLFDARIGGVRVDYMGDSVDGWAASYAFNNEYTFVVRKNPSQRFHITKYSPISANTSEKDNWADEVDGCCLALVAEDFRAFRLPKLIDSGQLSLKTATPILWRGKALVRLDFDRIFSNSHKPYPCWAIVDPNFHWAITSFELNFGSGIARRTVEYQADVADVAFPKHIVDQEFNALGNIIKQTTHDFQKPQPSEATAKDFTLEAFDLERPRSGLRQTAPAQSIPAPGPAGSSGSGALGPSSSATPASNTVKAGMPIFPTRVGVAAAVIGIVFYTLFLWTRQNGAPH